MIERRLLRQLERVAGRLRHRQTVSAWSVLWLAIAVIAGLILGLNWGWGLYVPQAVSGLVLIGLLAALLVFVMARWAARDYRGVAQRIESSYPELKSSLLAAIDQRPSVPGGRFGFMQHCVIEDSLRHAYRHAWVRVVPPSRLLLAHVGHLACLGCAAAALYGLSSWADPPAQAAGSLAAERQLIRTRGDFSVTVEPGNTEVERGASLLVMARFQGPLPPDARLVFTTASGNEGESVMSKSLDDPVFGGRIPAVVEDLYYRVAFADEQTAEFRASVFEYPRLVRADAKLVFPEYTHEPQRIVQDKRNLSAVEGTELTLICRLNKPVAEAWLIDGDDERLELAADEDEPAVYRVNLKLERSLRFELQLADDQGRRNKQPPKFVITVLKNKPPDLKLVRPSRDVQVSPLEELQLKANAWDDYGINRLGFSYTIGGQHPQDLVLGNEIAGKERVDVGHLVALEELEAQPDQLLAYHFWAEDTAADGSSRRVASDMFFAEVRHFEEIFRQGRQPPGGAQQGQPQMQGNARAAQDLAELQKQIMNATWRIIRREVEAEPTKQFNDDMLLVLESQTTALRQVDALAQSVQDAQSVGHVQDVRKHMLEAIALQARAQQGPDLTSLAPALASEQAAYQAMLKLRAREHQVMRSSQSSSRSSRGGSGNRAQQQLQQLELSEDQNRYETESSAQPDEQPADRENRQILSRLRELARRQTDLNERLKELQSSLQEAESEAQREELRRQLKRLQEEQEQILRDTDELESRMDQPQNQESMAEQRQQLEQTRSNVQQASQSLNEGRVSRAVSSGTRAEREFEELRDEFRRRTSGQFTEEMREMRQQAQQLDESEQEIASELENIAQPRPQSGSLRDTDQREQLEETLRLQQEKLGELLDRMRSTIEKSESSEPLLAEQLYDAARKAMQQNPDRSLAAAAESVRRGFLENAQQEEQDAREGIRQLRKGVDRAADSVLGDETEALRRARDQLGRLTQQLKDELERNDPQAADSGASEQDRQDGSRSERGSQAADAETDRQPGDGDSASDESAIRQSRQDPPDSAQNPPGSEEGQPSAPGEADQPGQRPARQQREGSSPSAGQESEAGRPSNGDSPAESPRRGRRGLRNLADGRDSNPNGPDVANFNAGNPGFEPLTGDNFREWSDRLRDVEEMVEDPELRAEAARIRDRARGFRQDVTRHSKEPQWDLVQLQLVRPLVELRDRVVEELLRRASKDSLVPIDRDPVPPKYSEQVERYYERLGSGR